MDVFDHDKQLSEAIIAGNDGAFKAFFERYSTPLFGYVLGLTKNQERAKDIVQMSFVSIWNRRTTLQPTNFRPLLFTTAKNLFIDEYRSSVSRANLYAELSLDAIENEPMDREHTEQQIKKLRDIIETLPERCRDILRMTKLEGLSQQEVADYLGISVRTVEAQIRIAYNKIRERFDIDDTTILFLLMWSFHPAEK